MPSESCYVTLMENAILLFVAYGLLDLHFEDVLHHGFLFFAVFIGLCACYTSTAAGFCLMLLDDDTSTQLLMLDAERPFNTPPPNNIAHVARILARAGTACSVALFVLFVTVGCEFFTEDSGPDSLPSIALKKSTKESVLETQFVVSTAFAVYFMIVLMLIGSNQQLNGIFLRLQYMTQSVPMSPAQAAAYASAADDFAMFVRVLLLLYMVVCDSSGTFELLHLTSGLDTTLRNHVSLLFIMWCFVTDALRALLPTALIFSLPLSVVDGLHVFVSIELAELVFRDLSLTNFACSLLVILDATCVVYASVRRLWQLRSMKWSGAKPKRADVTTAPAKDVDARNMDFDAMSNGTSLNFSEAHVNVDNIKMRVFEKKCN